MSDGYRVNRYDLIWIKRAGALLTLLGALSFGGALVYLTFRANGFWRPYKAISDFGRLKNPWALCTNLFAFIIPGASIIGSSICLFWREPSPGPLPPLLLATGGAFLVTCGLVPFPIPSHYLFAAAAALFTGLGICSLARP